MIYAPLRFILAICESVENGIVCLPSGNGWNEDTFFLRDAIEVQPGKREKKNNETKRENLRHGRGMRKTTAGAAACVTTSPTFRPT